MWFDRDVPDLVAEAADALAKARRANPEVSAPVLRALVENLAEARQRWHRGGLDAVPIRRFSDDT